MTKSTPTADERKATTDRRSGGERRQQDAVPATSYERRNTVEPRQPEVAELELSPEEMEAMGFKPPPPAAR